MTQRPEPRAQERKKERERNNTVDERGQVTGPAVRISGTRGTMF